MSRFEEEDFQRVSFNFLCSNCLWILFADNVGGATILTNFNVPKDYLCAISKNSVEKFWRRSFSKVYIKLCYVCYFGHNVGGAIL